MTRPGHFWEPVIPQTRRKPGGYPASTRNAAYAAIKILYPNPEGFTAVIVAL